jgi:hypothetical protein
VIASRPELSFASRSAKKAIPSPDTVVAGYSVAMDQVVPCATARRAATAIGAAAKSRATVRRESLGELPIAAL